MKGYRSVSVTAKKWGISIRWVNQYILGRACSWLRAFGALLGSSGGCGEAGAEKPGVKNGKEKKSYHDRLIFLNDG